MSSAVPGVTVRGLWWPPKAPLPKEAPLHISVLYRDAMQLLAK